MDLPAIIEEPEQRKMMQDGYPITRTPIFPHENSNIPGEIYQCENGFPILFVSTSPDRTPSNPESLEMIKELLREYFVYSPCLRRIVEEIPATATAISFAMSHFRMRKSCYYFYPKDDTYLHVFQTYQKLSENIQLTYFHENDVTYLAGICYFPPNAEQKSNCWAEKMAISMAIHSKEPFLRKNRYEQDHYLKYKLYGRDCGGRRVVVHKDGGAVAHLEVDYVKKRMNLVNCEDCKQEAEAYVETPAYPPTPPMEELQFRLFASGEKLLALWLNLVHEVPNESEVPLRHRITGAPCHFGFLPEIRYLFEFFKNFPNWVVDEEAFKLRYCQLHHEIAGTCDYLIKTYKDKVNQVRCFFLVQPGQLSEEEVRKISWDGPIPLVHKITGERLPEDERPPFRLLVPYLHKNPGWKFDKELWMELINYWEEDPSPLTIVDENEVRRILTSGGINSKTMKILRKMNKETKVPVVRKDTNEPPPESKFPKVKELTVHFMVNKNHKLDKERFEVISRGMSK
ncbi:unnamed protein product [Caenorhabditis brenneri]